MGDSLKGSSDVSSQKEKLDEVEACTLSINFKKTCISNFGVIENLISRIVKTHARGFVHICSMFMFGRVKSFGMASGMALSRMVGPFSFGSKLRDLTQLQPLFGVNRAGLRAPCCQAGIPAPRDTKSVIEKDS